MTKLSMKHWESICQKQWEREESPTFSWLLNVTLWPSLKKSFWQLQKLWEIIKEEYWMLKSCSQPKLKYIEVLIPISPKHVPSYFIRNNLQQSITRILKQFHLNFFFEYLKYICVNSGELLIQIQDPYLPYTKQLLVILQM